MRKIIVGMFMSLDGVVQGPGYGDEFEYKGWTMPFFTPEIGQHIGSQTAGSDTLLLGRTTYDTFERTFAGQNEGPASALNAIKKVVVSTTLKSANWNNSTLISANVAEEVAKLKQQDGKDISITGSTTLVQSLMSHNLIDDVVYTDLGPFDSVKSPCEICGGKRFKDEVLEYKLNGKSITEVLEMTVEQALEYFEIKEVSKKLQAMSDVGLNYLKLGQPLSTLSGGECQRIKLASELHKKGSIYVMDEPTTGLHMSDISHLLAIMDRLVDTGNTVIVIEHNLDVIKNADWIIDMGPEGGTKGGQVMFEGTPAELLNAKQSLTSAYLQN